MIPNAVIKVLNTTEDKVLEYLSRCDEVFDVPNGYVVRRKDAVHILAPQESLSGRKLMNRCFEILAKLHNTLPTIYAPIKPDNNRAIAFAKKLGFVDDHSDKTHVWFAHRSMQCV